MANEFTMKRVPQNTGAKACFSLRRKYIDSPEEMKGHESQTKLLESTMGNLCLNEARRRDKGKSTNSEAPNVPPLHPEARLTQPLTLLNKLISFILKNLRTLAFLKLNPSETPPQPLNSAKKCAFH